MLETEQQQRVSETVTREITSDKIEKVKHDLLQLDWSCITNCNDTDQCFETLVKKVVTCLDVHCPFVKKRVFAKKYVKPWMTKGLYKSCNRKNKLYEIFLRNRTAKNERVYKCYKNKHSQCRTFSIIQLGNTEEKLVL